MKKDLFFSTAFIILLAITLFFRWEIKNDLTEQKLAIEVMLRESPNFQYGSSNSKIDEDNLINIEKLRTEAVERYFFSQVQLVDGYYIPTVNLCLYELGQPLYPSYVYDTFSTLYHPQNSPYQKALVRFLLLPEDNEDFRLSSNCFIKEIKSEQDWQEIESYGFFRELF